MTRLYLSGPMTSYPLFNFPAFNEAEKKLRAAGFEVENPASKGIVDGWDWVDYLKFDLTQLFRCDAVATLEGWVESRGAWLEVSTARALGMSIRPVDDWIAPRLDEAA